MARSYAPTYTSIWHDDAFCQLSAHAQRVYWMAFSQPNISYCGVVSFTPRRWAGKARDTTARIISKAVDELEAGQYVVLDDETEELWVRSFVKHNKVLEQPKIAALMRQQFEHIHSPGIRAAFTAEYPTAIPTPADTPGDTPPHTPERETAGSDGSGSVTSSECLGPEPESEPSSSTVEDDDDPFLAEVFDALARRKLRDARSANVVVTHELNWLATVAVNDRSARSGEAQQYRYDYPGLTARQIADVMAGDVSILRTATRRRETA